MTYELVLTVAAVARSVGETRRTVAAWAAFLPAAQRDDLSIAVSELVTNAVTHGPRDGHVVVAARRESDAIQVSVSDDGASAAVAIREPHVRGGRGLRIVEKLSVAWGVEHPPTRVWFTMPAAPSP